MNHTEIDIELSPNNANFCLISGDEGTEFKLEIQSIRLFVKAVNLLDNIAIDIDRKLETNVAKYAVSRSELKSQFITEGRYEFISNLFTEQIPTRIILGLVQHENFIGKLDSDPFIFNHNNIKSISLQANSKSYPNNPYEADWDTHQYTRIYHDLYENCGFVNSSMGITMEEFKESKCFFVFNLTTDMEIDDTFDLIRNGTTSVKIRFDKPVKKGGLSLIIYGEFNGLLCVDKNRVVTSDLSIA
uniref:Uncharacterized protein n=1 Tax=Panagrolaimus sp. JU765 TaxID=591449 RepID=A0AC34Q467_9BILA